MGAMIVQKYFSQELYYIIVKQSLDPTTVCVCCLSYYGYIVMLQLYSGAHIGPILVHCVIWCMSVDSKHTLDRSYKQK